MTGFANGALARLRVAETEIERLRNSGDRRENRLATVEQQQKDQKEDINELREEVRRMRQALWALAVGIVIAALTISATVLAATGALA